MKNCAHMPTSFALARVALALALIVSCSLVRAESEHDCAQAAAVFVGVGEHGERVFSDQPTSGDSVELTLDCPQGVAAGSAQSSAAEMLELALILAADRRAESEQRRARQRALDERRTAASSWASQPDPRDSRSSDRTWVSTHPFGLHGGYHSRGNKRQPSGAHGPSGTSGASPEPEQLRKRFPTR